MSKIPEITKVTGDRINSIKNGATISFDYLEWEGNGKKSDYRFLSYCVAKDFFYGQEFWNGAVDGRWRTSTLLWDHYGDWQFYLYKSDDLRIPPAAVTDIFRLTYVAKGQGK